MGVPVPKETYWYLPSLMIGCVMTYLWPKLANIGISFKYQELFFSVQRLRT